MKRVLIFWLGCECGLICWDSLKWLDWHRRKHPGGKVWQTLWAWWWYQVASGYPPGELDHWFEGNPWEAR